MPGGTNPYVPSPLTLLTHLSTTLLTPTSLPHAFAAHKAKQQSLAAPAHGLDEGIDGVLIGLGANGGAHPLEGAPPGLGRGVVIEVEHRRRSGRGVREYVFLATDDQEGRPAGRSSENNKLPTPRPFILLDDHPCFQVRHDEVSARASAEGTPEAAAQTFSLGLTDRQRADRAAVILPYYDAQREGAEGVASGGRILYQMGVEDAGDYDSEEDEL